MNSLIKILNKQRSLLFYKAMLPTIYTMRKTETGLRKQKLTKRVTKPEKSIKGQTECGH